MPLTQATIDRLVDNFLKDLDRAEDLYVRIAIAGATMNDDFTYSSLLQPDRRDAAQFIFFEAAAQFETFSAKAFRLEVRDYFDVQPKRANYIMGNIDRGLAGLSAWASPKVLKGRAQALFGMIGFFARIDVKIGHTSYQRLLHAHKVRNRIAHADGNAGKQFKEILGQLNVPQRSRQGLSVGRLLMEYPNNVGQDDRWFYRFIEAYRRTANQFHRYMQL